MKYSARKVLCNVVALLTAAMLFTGGGCAGRRGDNSANPTDGSLQAKIDSMRTLRDSGKELLSLLPQFKAIAERDYQATEFADVQAAVADALLQAFNTYQIAGMNEEAVVWLDSMNLHPTALIKAECMRDLTSIRAYAYSRIDSMAKAESLILDALSAPLKHPDDKRLMRDYANASAIFLTNVMRENDVIEWANLALEHAQKCGATSTATYIRVILGDVYRRNGRISDALDVMSAALDDIRNKGDHNAEVNILNNLAQVYISYGMTTEADMYLDDAVRVIDEYGLSHPVILSETYIGKGMVKESTKPDSALYWYHRAEEAARGLAYNMGPEVCDMSIGRILSHYPDSADTASARLHRAARQAVDPKRYEAYFLLAQSYADRGDSLMAAAMLDSMYYLRMQVPALKISEKSLQWALKFYFDRGQDKELRRVASLIANSKEEDYDHNISQNMIRNVVDFHLYKQQQEYDRKYLESKVHNQELIIWFSVALAVIAIGMLFIIISRNRMARQKNDMEQRSREILNDLANEKEQGRRQREKYSKTIDTLHRTTMSMDLTTDEIKKLGERKFADRFRLCYPQFDENVASLGIRLSKRELHMAQLIIVGCSTSEIAEILSIAKQSVKVNRYRLRQKFNLEAGADLDDYLLHIASSSH